MENQKTTGLDAAFEFVKNLDRRWIFMLIALGVGIPLVFPITLPLTPDPEVISVFKFIDDLPEGKRVHISFDYDPASSPELDPMAIALIHHAFKKKLRIYATALYPVGPTMATLAFENVVKTYPKKKYGVDYIIFPYFPGPTTGLNQVAMFCADLLRAYPSDEKGVETRTYEIMRGVKTLKDMDVVISLSAGDPGIQAFISVANATHNINVAAGVTAVSAPRYYAFLASNQLFGILGGLRGAAAYEALVKVPGKGLAGMSSQSLAHLVIILLIVLSNIIYFVEKRLEQ
ncbi:hypothetical protein ACFL35_08010 [Candidatus Riflebacteria bacterium]